MLKLRSLSELASVSKFDLSNLHDQVHESNKNGNLSHNFCIWYHQQIVDVMAERKVIHYKTDSLDDASRFSYDFELVSDTKNHHQHTVVIDLNGNGFTDPIHDHYHVVKNSMILQEQQHAHSFSVPEEVANHNVEDAEESVKQWSLAAVEALLDHPLHVGRTGEQAGHSHLAALFNDAGFGRTATVNSHAHWIWNGVLQEEHGHQHGLPDWSSTIQWSEEPKMVEVPVPVPSEPGGKVFAPPQFGSLMTVSIPVRHVDSSEEAWNLWGTNNHSLLVIPVVDGEPLQAHLWDRNGQVEVRLFLRTKDVTEVFPQIRDSLCMVNLGNASQVVLVGSLTIRKEVRNASSAIQEILDGQRDSGMAAFCVEDCWFYNEPLLDTDAVTRRRAMEKVMANSTTPVLKQVPRAYVESGDRDKAVRVTEHNANNPGSVGIRWRDASSLLSIPSEELIIRRGRGTA